jgi:CheY-like chemotaxis protein
MESEERQVLVFVSEVSHLVGAIDLALGDHGCLVRFASDPEEAFDRLSRQDVDLIITDRETLRMEGGDLVERFQDLSPYVSIMILHGGEEPFVVPGRVQQEEGYTLVGPDSGRSAQPAPALFFEDCAE